MDPIAAHVNMAHFIFPGGKLGTSLQTDLGIDTDSCLFLTKVINTAFNLPCSTWLWNIARGISGEEVQSGGNASSMVVVCGALRFRR
ncbi:hypothetical protein HID58_010194 [Brassica napus]|uniref:Uncharacterized protein n=1 Tax=Brassica napus TaxID=3708 RepID=A0ABQ8DUK1_BRANA|nr:hypothetical protein HID58_010194 [Brassica napus]